MNRKCKFLALFISLALCLSMFTAISAFAVGEDETVEPVPTETQYVPPETQAPATQAPETQAPQTQAPETQAPQTYAPETQAPDNTPQENPVYNDNSGSNNDYNSVENYEERESNTTNEKAETSAVYDAENDDVSKETLKKGDWAKIAAQLKNSNGKEDDDFAFIRNNDQSGANNGEWMLILGIAMEALGVGIVIFLIVMKVRQKKAVAKSGVGSRGVNGAKKPSRGTAPAHSRPANAERARPERASQPQRTTKKQRSKFDTAEIAVPKHARESGGRYKPRH